MSRLVLALLGSVLADKVFEELADKKNCASYKWLDVGNVDAAYCYNIVQKNEECSQKFFTHAGHLDGNCACMTDESVDCSLAANQLDDNNVTLYKIVTPFSPLIDKKNCASYKWLDKLSENASACFDIIKQDNACSQKFFSHAGHLDGNCGCMTDPSVDCTLTENQLDDYNVTLYQISTTTTTMAAASFHRLADRVVCKFTKWLNVMSTSPSACHEVIKQDKMCSQRFFSHAGRSDGNCGCLTDATVDCTLAMNQLEDHTVTTYQVSEASPHSANFFV